MSKALATAVIALAMSSSAPCGAQASGYLDVTNAQPLLVISRELSEKYDWIISYEDAPVTSDRYLVRENDKNGRTWVFARPSRIVVPAESSARINAEARKRIIQQAIDQYNRTAAPARYGFSVNDDIVRIYPKETLSGGELTSFTPLLDTPISLPFRKYQVGEVIAKILAEVGRLRGARISIGNAPPNLLPIEITEEARNESAYSVLDRALDAVNGRRLVAGDDRLVFRSELVNLPESNSYIYNVSVAKRIPVPAARPHDNPSVTAPADLVYRNRLSGQY